MSLFYRWENWGLINVKWHLQDHTVSMQDGLGKGQIGGGEIMWEVFTVLQLRGDEDLY